MSDMIKVTGLWINDSNGKKYMSGTMGTLKVLIFKNERKESDKHPDYTMYFAPNEKKEGQSFRDNSGQGHQSVQGPPPFVDDIPAPRQQSNQRDIPF